jgi:hypothetical protein
LTLSDITKDQSLRLALIIGNGINRFDSSVESRNNSWDSMLLNLWSRFSTAGRHMSAPEGIAITEFYDALDLTRNSSSVNLQKEFCNLMKNWVSKSHHKNIASWAQEKSVPILTTNFEETLSSSITENISHTDSKKFTDYYPWGSYFSNSTVINPSTEFGIWHINGIQRYSRSIRLGLSHYMGSVERARSLIHKGNDRRLFSGKNVDEWAGYQTWLHVVFNNDLVFIGLSLESTEVFLRWLLIERAKYFEQFPLRRKKAYFVHAGQTDLSTGQTLFLKCVGVEVIKEVSYENLYLAPWQLS